MDAYFASQRGRTGVWAGFSLAAFCGAIAFFYAVPAFAADEVDHTVRAEQLREASKLRARQGLGYDDIGDANDSFDQSVDYYTLGLMIQRLGALIQEMETDASNGAVPSLGTGLAAGPTPRYGPSGPTKDSVRVILEYRLLLNGNPRLKPGRVEDAGDVIIASVVTRDGALVEEFAVDKETGVWKLRRGE